MTAILRSYQEVDGVPVNGPVVDLNSWPFEWEVVVDNWDVITRGVERGLSIHVGEAGQSLFILIWAYCMICNDEELSLNYSISAAAAGDPILLTTSLTVNGVTVASSSDSTPDPGVSVVGSTLLPPSTPEGNKIWVFSGASGMMPDVNSLDLFIDLSRDP